MNGEEFAKMHVLFMIICLLTISMLLLCAGGSVTPLGPWRCDR